MTTSDLSEIAVVTGGASGIGAAICRHLRALGATVVIVDRSEASIAFAKTIDAHAVLADVSDADGLARCAATIEAQFGPVGILVNSAGIIQKPLTPDALPIDTWDDIIRIDQRGTYLSCVVFGAYMTKRNRGSIVNIASITGLRSVPLHAYAPAKAAVISITECLAAEWGPFGVRVNAVSPGYTLTPVLREAIEKGERDPSRLTANSALGRLVTPEDVANVVAFLVGPGASAITGANIPVDCGWLVASTWQTYGGLRGPGTVGKPNAK